MDPHGKSRPETSTGPGARKIIIDTDPGKDDAIAILLALASDRIDLLGLTIVAGNVSLELCAANACKICELAGREDVGIYAGATRPLSREPVTAEEIHGRTGLPGTPLPPAAMQPREKHAVDFLIDTLRDAPSGTVTLSALGPLTNIAQAILRAPEIMQRAAGIVLMGGGWFDHGNTTPAAEFNFYADPEAADIVMRSGLNIVILPLDCTHQVIATPDRIAQLRGIGPVIGAQVASWAASTFNGLPSDKLEGIALHDPCVIAYLLDPDLFSGRKVNVAVETKGALTAGMSVVDWDGRTDRAPNALFLTEADAPRLFSMLQTALSRLEPES